MAELKLMEIAARIHAHLKGFEADPKINVTTKYVGGDGKPRESLRPFYVSGAYVTGRYVGIRYISFQGSSHLTKADALKYLQKLDGGFVGRHSEALKEKD